MIETRENIALMFGNDAEIKGYAPIKPERSGRTIDGRGCSLVASSGRRGA